MEEDSGRESFSQETGRTHGQAGEEKEKEKDI